MPWHTVLLVIEVLTVGLILLLQRRAADQPTTRTPLPLWAWVYRNTTVAVGVVFATSLAVSLLLGLLKTPEPVVHDEFSYLLTADTFSQGRLANPTHPLWRQMETFHVIHEPTYVAKYPPGQGAVLAIGQVLFGSPIAGVWLSLALACAAVCWMLQAWVPRRWAFIGGLLVCFHPAIQYCWGQSFWGGALAMLGGALVFGAAPRLARRIDVAPATLLGLGLVLLAFGRPFEGLVASLPVMVWLALRLYSDPDRNARVVVLYLATPVMVFMLAGAVAWMTYNVRTTGSPFEMAYSIYEDRYDPARPFVFERPQHVSYGHADLERFWRWSYNESYLKQRTFLSFVFWRAVAWASMFGFFVPPILVLPLLTIRGRRSSPRTTLALLTVTTFLIAQLTVRWTYPHYFAPITVLFFYAFVEGLRHVTRALPRAPIWLVRLSSPMFSCSS